MRICVSVVCALCVCVCVWCCNMLIGLYGCVDAPTSQDLVGLHLFMAVADWVCAVLACVIAVTLVRLQHLLYVLESRKWWTQPAGIERCAVFYSSTLQVSLLLVLDSMSFAQVLVVAVGVVRLPSMLTRIVNTFSAYSRARGELLRRQRHFHDAGGDVNGNGNGAGGNGNVNARSASPVGDAHSADGRPVVSEREPRDATMRRSSSARDRARSDVALVVAERPPPRTMTKEFLKSTLPKDEPVQSAGILLWAGNVAHSDTLLGFQCQWYVGCALRDCGRFCFADAVHVTELDSQRPRRIICSNAYVVCARGCAQWLRLRVTLRCRAWHLVVTCHACPLTCVFRIGVTPCNVVFGGAHCERRSVLDHDDLGTTAPSPVQACGGGDVWFDARHCATV